MASRPFIATEGGEALEKTQQPARQAASLPLLLLLLLLFLFLIFFFFFREPLFLLADTPGDRPEIRLRLDGEELVSLSRLLFPLVPFL